MASGREEGCKTKKKDEVGMQKRQASRGAPEVTEGETGQGRMSEPGRNG